MRKGRRCLAGAPLLAVVTACPASAEEAAGTTASDSRADVSGLPEGEAPWWPSRYGADDQIGSLNELTPERVAAAARLDRPLVKCRRGMGFIGARSSGRPGTARAGLDTLGLSRRSRFDISDGHRRQR